MYIIRLNKKIRHPVKPKVWQNLNVYCVSIYIEEVGTKVGFTQTYNFSEMVPRSDRHHTIPIQKE